MRESRLREFESLRRTPPSGVYQGVGSVVIGRENEVISMMISANPPDAAAGTDEALRTGARRPMR